MDSIIWWLHAHVARAAAEYSSTHPQNTEAALAIPWVITTLIYAWLVWTLLLGIRAQRSIITRRTPAKLSDIPEDANEAPGGIFQAPNGRWMRPTYNKQGEIDGAESVQSPVIARIAR